VLSGVLLLMDPAFYYEDELLEGTLGASCPIRAAFPDGCAPTQA
jgi:hypothetical protein